MRWNETTFQRTASLSPRVVGKRDVGFSILRFGDRAVRPWMIDRAQSGHLAGGDRQGRRNQENEANGLSLCHGEILELCPITVNGVTDRGVVMSWHSLADLPV